MNLHGSECVTQVLTRNLPLEYFTPVFITFTYIRLELLGSSYGIEWLLYLKLPLPISKKAGVAKVAAYESFPPLAASCGGAYRSFFAQTKPLPSTFILLR